jgi:glutathione S-transferase
MKLYYTAGACSLAPHILLNEIKMPHVAERVDLAQHKTADGADYYSVNPKGSVPVLMLEDGTKLTEGPIIAQYIADKAARTDLMPAAGTIARYRVMEWQNFVTSELHKFFSPLFRPDFDEHGKEQLRAALRKKYEWVAKQLADKEYLTGPTFTAADAYLYTVTRWAPKLGVDLTDLAPLQNFMKRVAARPAVRATLQEEGLPTEQQAA